MVCGSMTTWPKARSELTEKQTAIVEDWNREFSGSMKADRFGWIQRFDHEFPLASAGPGLRTLELGAGAGTHLAFEPVGEYVALEMSQLVADLIPPRPGLEVLVANCDDPLPFEDASFDRVLAIHVLEHLYDLPATLGEVARVLRDTGTFSVVIPCEGGRGYGIGRRLTSQRLFERRYGVPYDWIISYAHCNTAREVMAELDTAFRVVRRRFFPTGIPNVDLNLTIGLELARRS